MEEVEAHDGGGNLVIGRRRPLHPRQVPRICHRREAEEVPQGPSHGGAKEDPELLGRGQVKGRQGFRNKGLDECVCLRHLEEEEPQEE